MSQVRVLSPLYSDPTEVRQVRLARNQALFRSVDERVEKVSEQYATQARSDSSVGARSPTVDGMSR